jgi:hypothetical protein
MKEEVCRTKYCQQNHRTCNAIECDAVDIQPHLHHTINHHIMFPMNLAELHASCIELANRNNQLNEDKELYVTLEQLHMLLMKLPQKFHNPASQAL